jgi:hypothetical protein
MLYHSSASVLLMRKTTNIILEQAYLALHWPEQLNSMDPSEIASELCEYLHPLIAADILEVYVQHIKYRVEFLNRILSKNFIKRRGEWETQVINKSMSVR